MPRIFPRLLASSRLAHHVKPPCPNQASTNSTIPAIRDKSLDNCTATLRDGPTHTDAMTRHTNPIKHAQPTASKTAVEPAGIAPAASIQACDHAHLRPRPLYGLILAGGAGLRLGGVDKARLMRRPHCVSSASTASRVGPPGTPSVQTAHATQTPSIEHPIVPVSATWLIADVVKALRPQVDRIVIARAHPDPELVMFGDVVVDLTNPIDGHCATQDASAASHATQDAGRPGQLARGRRKPGNGPLAGLLAAMQRFPDADWLTLPVDTPFVPHNLVWCLAPRSNVPFDSADESIEHRRIRHLHDGERAQPLHAWIPAEAQSALHHLWTQGERSVRRAFMCLSSDIVYVPQWRDRLLNINTPEDLATAGLMPPQSVASPSDSPRSADTRTTDHDATRDSGYTATNGPGPRPDTSPQPVTAPECSPARVWLAITARSGTGKTTLLAEILKRLRGRNLPPGAVIKHTHHDVELDPPHKDSARLMAAGALPTMLVTPSAARLIIPFDPSDRITAIADDSEPLRSWSRWLPVDREWVLVEGCRHCQQPDLECIRLWRPLDGHIERPDDPYWAADHELVQALSDPATRALAAPRSHHRALRHWLAQQHAPASTPELLDLDDLDAITDWVETHLRTRLQRHVAATSPQREHA